MGIEDAGKSVLGALGGNGSRPLFGLGVDGIG